MIASVKCAVRWQDGAPPSGPKLRAGPAEKRGNPPVPASSTGATTRAASGRVSEEGTRDVRVSLFAKVAAVLLLALCAQGCALVDWMMEAMVTWGATTLVSPVEDAAGGDGP